MDSTTIIDDREAVISTVDLTYCVGGLNGKIVDGVNLTIPRGKIYSLLGPSGCGKTTLLRCVVGYLQPNCGEILFFDKTHQSDDLHIPGKNVGYMPQESGLYEYMTIGEILFYYGRIYQMSKSDIKKRISEMIAQLELPSEKRKIYNLSGGQQRRVSFAIALIHCPPLLILDEPTSGADPVLREKIWTLLVDTSLHFNSTIIITTHYIEEARRSDLVAFMRDGKILHRNSPINLLKKYSTLENAFLVMCSKDVEELNLGQQFATNSSFARSKQPSKENLPLSNNQCKESELFWTKLTNNCRTWLIIFYALFWRFFKNELTLTSLIYQYFIPFSQMFLCIYGVGGPPFGISVGVVNYESDARLSKQFIASLDKQFFSLHHYISIDDASKDLEANKLSSIIYIQNGFTEAFLEKIYATDSLTDFAANKSNIIIIGDTTEKVIHFSIVGVLEREIKLFVMNVLTNLTNNYHNGNHITDPPLIITKSIHDKNSEGTLSLRNAFFVGILVSIIHFSSLMQFSLILMNERNSQSYERNSVAGIKTYQILLAVAISRTLFMIPMMLLITILPIQAVQLPVTFISVLKSMPLLIAVSTSGITIGMIILTITNSIGSALSVGCAFTFCLLFTSGSIWPLESLNIYLRNFLLLGPTTMPIKAILNIYYKNGDIFHDQSLIAFGMLLLWTILPLIIGKFFRK